jgi:cysteine-rich repeat protein
MKQGAIVAVLVLAAGAVPAEAQVALLGGRVARIVNRSGVESDSAAIKFKRDPGLTVTRDPRCPATSTLRLAAGATSTNIPLPCGFWAAAGAGFKYTDPSGSAGGVRKILYRPDADGGTLFVKLHGPGFAAFAGPIVALDVRLTIGFVAHCGRFANARRNDAERIVMRDPTVGCGPLCGNGLREAPEQCDGAALGGQSCASLGQGTGTLACGADCTFDTSGCQPPNLCGNGALDPGETCDDGNQANGDCCSSVCQAETGTSCADGDACNGAETCDATGQCGAGAPLDCDDGNFCTGDACVAAVGCVNDPAPGAACEGDGNFCTDDTCDATGVCRHIPNARVCDDGQECTVGDTCADGVCSGTFVSPWINEIDYDDSSQPPLGDRDEFVEIAGPAGLDLGGYRLVSVEGNQTCGTPLGATTGEAHFTATIPAGTVLADDSGSGVGLFVACFRNATSAQSTSTDVGAACDAVLPAISPDSNLMNGNLLNLSETDCPDGLLLLDATGNAVDAVSWEGVVPNSGSDGVLFHQPSLAPPYSLPRDEGGSALGDAPGVSLEKNTSTVQRAAATGDWSESGACVNQDITELTLGTCATNTATPGALNVPQSAALLSCPVVEPGCGNGVVDAGEDCEITAHCPAGWVCSSTCTCTLASLCGNGVINVGEQCDEGAANADVPNATCRTNCLAQRCGDGITDTAFAETCETNGECAAGEGCYQCGCEPPLGALTFRVAPGPMGNCPADDGAASYLKIGPPLAGICSGSNGDFSPGPLALDAGAPGPDGIASLRLTARVVVGATLPDPGITVEGYACFELTPDPTRSGWLDCDGRSSANASLTVNSNGANADDPPVLEVGADGANSGAGSAVIPIVLRAAQTTSDTQNCSTADFSASDPVAAVLTTATATATIQDTYQGGNAVASLTGRPFDCAGWTNDSGASVVVPNANTDLVLPILGRYDVAQALRLEDD